METLKSWKFWITVVVTTTIGLPPMFLWPLWLGGIVILATLGIFVFYFKCEFGTFAIPWFTKMGIFGGYVGREIPEKPGPVFRGLALGSLFIWVIPTVAALMKN
ncbi:MAG: hypothetical protein AAB725_01955 [Patescibacteria group bacterium]